MTLYIFWSLQDSWNST